MPRTMQFDSLKHCPKSPAVSFHQALAHMVRATGKIKNWDEDAKSMPKGKFNGQAGWRMDVPGDGEVQNSMDHSLNTWG